MTAASTDHKEPNATAASLLGFLLDGPRTGYELNEIAEQRIGNFWNLTRSQVYRELKNLESAGYVLAGPPGKRGQRKYTVTAIGRRAFQDWILRGSDEEHIRFPMLLGATFLDHIPREAYRETLHRYHAIHSERLHGYEAMATELRARGHEDLTLEFGQRYERTVIGWIEHALQRLGDSKH